MDLDRNLWIGLTGGIASGKSTVTAYLRSKGYAVIDADTISHELLAPKGLAVPAIVQAFGGEVLSSDGSIDRGKLGPIVFSDSQKRKKLNQIVHPLVRQRTQEKKEEFFGEGHQCLFNDVPLLFESQLEASYNSTVVVYCPEQLQKERLKLRNSLSDQEIEQRLASQMSIEEKAQKATYVIDNSGSFEELEKNTDQYLKDLLKSKG